MIAFTFHQTDIWVRKKVLGCAEGWRAGQGAMQEQLSTLLSAVVGDAFGVRGWLMGNLAGASFAVAVQQVQRRRAERARDILLDEMSRGEKTLSIPEVEEAAAVLLRYGRAAQEGAACLNLRLMAKVIAGQAQRRCLYFYAAAEAVTRTALLRMADAVGEHMLFQPTRLLDKLYGMAPFEAALRDEPT